MSFLFRNFAPFAVAAVASVLVWLFGGLSGRVLTPVAPWLFLLLLEVIFFFPQRRADETTYDARVRVWHALRRDPLVLVAVVFFALLLIPFVNNGLCPVCDAKAIAQGLSPKPPVPIIPFCVSRLDHLNVVLWFAIALSSVVAVRHALTRSGKRLVLELIVWNGSAVAALGFLQSAMNAPGPLWSTNGEVVWGVSTFFATFGCPNMAGDYFTMLFGISLALWRQNLLEIDAERLHQEKQGIHKRRMFWSLHFFLIPAGVFFYAAQNTLSRAAILLVSVTAFVYFLHTFISFVAHKHKADRVKAAAWTMLGLAIVVYVACLFAPKGIEKEVDTIDTRGVLDRVSGRGQYHLRIAQAIFKDYPLFGCGGWGYVHLCIPKMSPKEYKSLQIVGGINVHNDYLQILAEHGLVGFGALFAIVAMLIWPVASIWRRLAREARFVKGAAAPAKPRQIFALPAPVFFILTALIATMIHAFGDCPFRSPAILTLYLISLAALPGFLPRKES